MGRELVKLLLAKGADGQGVVGVRNATHLGRIGEWAERVADEGLLFAAFVNTGGIAQTVAPPGSADRKLATNPIAFRIPTYGALPFSFVVDFATSQVAHGKITKRATSGEALPTAWTTTADGTPVRDAEAFEYGAGALLPLGGRASGHKGFGLAVVAKLFAGLLGDASVAGSEDPGGLNAATFISIDPMAFTTETRAADRLETLVTHLRDADQHGDVPVGDAAMGDELLLPGEVEKQMYREQGSRSRRTPGRYCANVPWNSDSTRHRSKRKSVPTTFVHGWVFQFCRQAAAQSTTRPWDGIEIKYSTQSSGTDPAGTRLFSNPIPVTSVPLVRSLFGDDADIIRDANFQLLLLANLVAPLGTALISPLLDSLQEPYGATNVTIGLMMTAYTSPAIFIIPLAGVFADKYGRKPLIVGGLLLFSFSGLALTATTDFTLVLALRFVQGIGFASVTPTIITSIGDLYSGTAEATGQGLRFGVSGLTQTVFPLIGGGLVVVAWQFPLFLFAIGIPIAIVVALTFEEQISTEEDGEPIDRQLYLRKLLDIVSHPRVAAILVMRTVPVFLYMMYMTYVSILVVRNMSGSPGTAGAMVAIGSVAYAVSATQIGRVGVSFEGRVWPLAGAIVFMGVGIVVFAFAPNVWIGALCVVFLGTGFGVGLSLVRSVITGFTQSELRGGIVSLGESLGRLAATTAPVVAGLLIGMLEGSVGTTRAVQVSVAAVAIVAVLVGLAALAVARTSPAVSGRDNPVAGD